MKNLSTMKSLSMSSTNSVTAGFLVSNLKRIHATYGRFGIWESCDRLGTTKFKPPAFETRGLCVSANTKTIVQRFEDSFRKDFWVMRNIGLLNIYPT